MKPLYIRILIASIVVLMLLLFVREKRQADNAIAKNVVLQEQLSTAKADSTKIAADLIDSQKREKIARSKELADLAQLFAAETKDRSWMGIEKSKQWMDLSLLLSVEAHKLDDNFQTRDALLKALFTFPYSRKYLPIHTEQAWRIQSVTFSPDGSLMASGSLSGEIRFWDMKTGRQSGDFIKTSGGRVDKVSFSPDGKTLASVDWTNSGGILTLWDINTHKMAGRLTNINSFVYSPNGKYLATWGKDGLVLYDPITYKPLEMGKNVGLIWDAVFSPDGKFLAVRSNDAVILWDLATGKIIWQDIKTNKEFANIFSYSTTNMEFSPDGRFLVSAGVFLGVKTGAYVGKLPNRKSNITDLAFTLDGRYLALSHDDGTISLWEITTSRVISPEGFEVFAEESGQPLIGHTDRINDIAISPDGEMLVSGSSGDNSIILWDLTSAQPTGKDLIGHKQIASVMTFSPDNKILASGEVGGDMVILWDIQTGKQIGKPLENTNNGIRDIVFSPDGNTLAISVIDGKVTLWNIAQRKAVNLSSNISAITCLAFSPGGKILAGGNWDGVVTFWDTVTHQQVGKELLTSIFQLQSMAFSPDGKFLALGGERYIHLLDATTYKVIKALNTSPLSISEGNVTSLSFSPDSKLLAAGYRNDTVALWNITTYAPEQEFAGLFSGHYKPIFNLGFRNDEKTLFMDNMFWDLATFRQIYQPLTNFSSSVGNFVPSADQKYVALHKQDGTILLIDMNPEFWIQKACEIVQRNLTRGEWKQYEFTEPYHATCPQWAVDSP
jgi:WD40 repeat protein